VKRIGLIIMVTLLALAIAVPATAFAGATVLCQGNVCGGGGISNYQYDVTGTDGLMLHQFHVGTCDPNIANYTNIVGPAGWTFNIFEIIEEHDGFTPHGGLSQPSGECQLCVVWTEGENGPGLQNAVFGFDNPNLPHDVGWFINDNVVAESWAAAVGMGAGPVHGPTVPEPASILVFSTGLMSLTGFALRRKH
jgi:hypothetical protein